MTFEVGRSDFTCCGVSIHGYNKLQCAVKEQPVLYAGSSLLCKHILQKAERRLKLQWKCHVHSDTYRTASQKVNDKHKAGGVQLMQQ